MKKMSLTGLLCGVFLLSFAQSGYNVFTQNIHFVPEPTAQGFMCGSTTMVAFTMGLTTQDDAPFTSNDPVKIKVTVTGFQFVGNAASVVSGNYASHFSWAFDPLDAQCIIGTQQNSLPGTGFDPLFPNPLSTGSLLFQLTVPSNLPNASLLKVEAMALVSSYMTTSNSLFDDQEITQTNSYCASTTGCSEAPTIIPSSQHWFCEGSNIVLRAEGSLNASFSWLAPSTSIYSLDSSINGISQLSLQNLASHHAGIYKVVQQKPGCSLPSDTAYFHVTVDAYPEINFLTTTCNGNHAFVQVHSSLSNVVYAMNGGVFSSNALLQTDVSSAFTVEVKQPNSECVGIFSGSCTSCSSQSGCLNPPRDSLVVPPVACTALPIELKGYFTNADSVHWESSGTGSFSATSCDVSPCTVYYTPSASDKQQGYVSIMLQTNDVDSNGSCLSARSIKTIQLIDQLVAPEIITNAPLCEGGNLMLSAVSALGTILWTYPDASIHAGKQLWRNNAQVMMTGNYITTLSAYGCSSLIDTTFVQINPAPALQLSVLTQPEFCANHANGSIHVSVQGGTGDYLICSNSASCINNDSATFSNLAPGNFTITAVDQQCPTHEFTEITTVHAGTLVPPPMLTTSNLHVCEQEALNLIATTQQGTTAVWTKYQSSFYNTGNLVALGKANMHEGGYYFVKAIDSSGCASTPVSLHVNVYAMPVISEVLITCNAQQQADIHVNTLGGSWLYSLNGLQYQSSPDFTNLSAGIYTVYVKNAASLCEVTWPIEVVNCACGITLQASLDVPFVACGSLPIPVTATFTGTSFAEWSSSGSGSFLNGNGTNPLQASYVPSANDLQLGEVNLILTLQDPDGSGPCTHRTIKRKMILMDSLFTPQVMLPSHVCENDTLQLLTSNYTLPLNWFTPQSNFLQVNQAMVSPVTMASEGWYVVEASGTNCSTQRDSSYLTVQATPLLTVSNAVFPELCKGNGNGSIKLEIQGGSSRYQIYNVTQENFSVSSSPAWVKWMPPGQHSFLISDTACAHTMAIEQVFLEEGYSPNAPTQVSYNGPLCEGDTMILSAQGDAGNYLWIDLKNNTVDSGMVVVKNDVALMNNTTYKVMRLENGCASDYVLFDTRVFSLPEITSIDTTCTNGINAGQILVHANVASVDTLEFALNDGVYQSSPLFENLSNGSYKVSVRTKGSACSVFEKNIELYCNCYCNKEADVTIYPIPNQGSFTVAMTLFDEVETALIKLVDLTGRVIHQEYFEPDGLQVHHAVQLKNIAKGNYKLQLILDDDTITKSLSITE